MILYADLDEQVLSPTLEGYFQDAGNAQGVSIS
jgi:hypothetical protein